MRDKILLATCAFIYVTFSGFFPLQTVPLWSIQIKKVHDLSMLICGQNYTILLSFNVIVILFQPLRLLPFTFSSSLFLTLFNLSKVINIVLHKLVHDNMLMRNSAIVLPSHGLNYVIIFRGTFFSFEVGDENHQVYDHR